MIALLSEATSSGGARSVEAKALGFPAVAAEVGGIPRVISDGESGLLVRIFSLTRGSNQEVSRGETGRTSTEAPVMVIRFLPEEGAPALEGLEVRYKDYDWSLNERP